MKLAIFHWKILVTYLWLLITFISTKVYFILQFLLNFLFLLGISSIIVTKNALGTNIAWTYFLLYFCFNFVSGIYICLITLALFKDEEQDGTNYLITSTLKYSKLNLYCARFLAIFIITFSTIMISTIIPLLCCYGLNVNYGNYFFTKFYGFVATSMILIIFFFILTLLLSFLFSAKATIIWFILISLISFGINFLIAFGLQYSDSNGRTSPYILALITAKQRKQYSEYYYLKEFKNIVTNLNFQKYYNVQIDATLANNLFKIKNKFPFFQDAIFQYNNSTLGFNQLLISCLNAQTISVCDQVFKTFHDGELTMKLRFSHQFLDNSIFKNILTTDSLNANLIVQPAYSQQKWSQEVSKSVNVNNFKNNYLKMLANILVNNIYHNNYFSPPAISKLLSFIKMKEVNPSNTLETLIPMFAKQLNVPLQNVNYLMNYYHNSAAKYKYTFDEEIINGQGAVWYYFYQTLSNYYLNNLLEFDNENSFNNWVQGIFMYNEVFRYLNYFDILYHPYQLWTSNYEFENVNLSNPSAQLTKYLSLAAGQFYLLLNEKILPNFYQIIQNDQPNIILIVNPFQISNHTNKVAIYCVYLTLAISSLYLGYLFFKRKDLV